MIIDKTITTSGGELFTLDLEGGELKAVLTQPEELTATLAPTTLSISWMYIDSTGDSEELPPTPEDPYLFYGVTSETFGFGGAPPYLQCYPLNGIF